MIPEHYARDIVERRGDPVHRLKNARGVGLGWNDSRHVTDHGPAAATSRAARFPSRSDSRRQACVARIGSCKC